MSNYPPGVTGREFEIAGPDYEEDRHLACEAEGVAVAVVDAGARVALKQSTEYVANALAALDSGDAETAARWLRNASARLPMAVAEVVDIGVCPFEGDVTVAGYHGEETWTCPLCETEHTTDAVGE